MNNAQPTTKLTPLLATTPLDDVVIPVSQEIGVLTTGIANRFRRPFRIASRIVLACMALWLFISAIAVMKNGAAALAPALNGSFLTDSLSSTLGFGWLSAMLVMSGSPIAVSALTFLDGGAISAEGAFTMLTGSRLGASFVVLAVAFVYALRGRQTGEARRASLSIGFISLILTAVVYLPAMAIGLWLLSVKSIENATEATAVAMPDVITMVTTPVANAVQYVTTGGLQFLIGIALLMCAVRMIDASLPEAAHSPSLEEHAGWRDRKWLMFAIGSGVAFVTMSVSVALTVLVPAVAKGYFQRRQVFAYIMGANIMTLGDTLLTAYIIENHVAVHVVIAELLATASITLLLIGFFYKPLTEKVVALADGIVAKPTRLGGVVAVLFAAPILLIWLL